MNVSPDKLHQQQRAFAKMLRSATIDGHAVEEVALNKNPNQFFSAHQRLQIYRNNFAISLHEALAGVYPVVRKLVGDDFFRQLTHEYLCAYSLRTGNVHDFGDEFAAFLAELPEVATLPYLPDMARLEWAYHQVFHARDGGVLNISALAMLSEKQMQALRLQVSDSSRYLSSPYPVLAIWELNQDLSGATTVSLDEGGINVVVVRHAEHIRFLTVSAGAFALLDSIAHGHVFSQACETALNVEPNCDIAATLQFLVSQRIVSGFCHPSFGQDDQPEQPAE